MDPIRAIWRRLREMAVPPMEAMRATSAGFMTANPRASLVGAAALDGLVGAGSLIFVLDFME